MVRGSPSVGECGSASLPPYLCPLHIDRAEVEVVLHGEILAPGGRVVDGVVEFDHAIEGILRFLLVLDDVHEQGGNGNRGDCRHAGRDEQKSAVARIGISAVRHLNCSPMNCSAQDWLLDC